MSPLSINAMRGGKPLRITLRDVPQLDKEQEDAARMMKDAKHMLLFSDPGAGKTLTALRALELAQLSRLKWNKPNIKALITCPPVAVSTWVTWVASYCDHLGWPASIEVISNGNSPVTIQGNRMQVVIIPHSLLSRDNPRLIDRLTGWGYDVFINDESDSMNGWTSKRTISTFGQKFDSGLAGKAQYRWMLTGTAIPRYNDGLYPALRNLFPDKLAKHHVKEPQNFLDTFTTQEIVKYGKMLVPKKQVSGSRNNVLLNRILFDDADGYPCAVRNKLDLDVKLTVKHRMLDFTLSDELQELERDLEESFSMSTGPQGDDGRAIDPRMNTALRMLGEELAPFALKDIVAERTNGDKSPVLLLYWHTSVGNYLVEALSSRGFRVSLMSGATTSDEDAETERDFNAGKLDYVVGQIKAMGVAINLQEACHKVRFIEDSFSDAANQQAYQRVYRRGQTHDVEVVFYRATQSNLADMKPRVAEKKRKGAKEVLDGHLDR